MPNEDLPNPLPTPEAQQELFTQKKHEYSLKMQETGLLTRVQTVLQHEDEQARTDSPNLLAYTAPEAADAHVAAHAQKGIMELEATIDPDNYSVNHQIGNDLSEHYSVAFGKLRNVRVGTAEVDPEDNLVHIIPAEGFTEADVELVKGMVQELEELKASGSLPDLTTDLQWVHTSSSETNPVLDETTETADNKTEMQRQSEEAAWKHYVPIGSAEYEQANNERIKDGKVKVVTVGTGDQSVTMVASIKVDPKTGKAISGHENHPEAQSMQDTEAAFANYLAATPPEQRLVIYEGDKRVFEDRDEAITKAADSGLAQYLAAKEQIETMSAEPIEAEKLEVMEKLGVSREELLALSVAQGLESHFASGEADFLAGYINHQAASLGIEGFHEFSEAEKQEIVASGKLDQVKDELNKKVADNLLPALNAIYRPALEDKDLFVITDSGQVAINPEFADAIATVSMDKLNWSGSHRINEVAKLSMEMRDRVIFHRILEAYDNHKRPFVVYGGSHIVTLQPALEAYVAQYKK